MSEQDIASLQLGQVFPEDMSLAPIEMSIIIKFLKNRGYLIRKIDLRENELTQELISRIRSQYDDFKPLIEEVIKQRSDRFYRNTYFEMVYAILNHYHFGIAGKSGKLKKISEEEYAVIFDIDRKTLKRNQEVVDFYNRERYKIFNNLEQIFYKIENNIFDN